MLESIRKNKHYLFFILISFIFLMVGSVMYPLNMLSTHGNIFGIIAAILFVSYALVYFLWIRKREFMEFYLMHYSLRR